MKKLLLGLFLFLATACSAERQVAFVRYCPNVYLNPVYNHMTRLAGKDIQFKAELIGYEGYCRTNEKTKETYAVIAPIFEIVRMAEAASPEVVFHYYADTSANSDKGMGRATYEVVADIKKAGEKVIYQGNYEEIRIPQNTPGYRIELGLVLSAAQMDYNRKHGLSIR